jgi:hypothetical protein
MSPSILADPAEIAAAFRQPYTVRLPGALTAAEAKARRQEQDRTWYFVLNDGATTGERWPCRECGQKHRHFTYRCIPVPIRGLQEALMAYAKVRDERVGAAVDAMTEAFPDLRQFHPETARTFTAAHGIQTGELPIVAVPLGKAVPIRTDEARRFAEKINAVARKTLIVPPREERSTR